MQISIYTYGIEMFNKLATDTASLNRVEEQETKKKQQKKTRNRFVVNSKYALMLIESIFP